MLSILDKALQAILKMLKKKDERVLLWSNASPNSKFVAQTVPVQASGCDAIEIIGTGLGQSESYGKGFKNVKSILVGAGGNSVEFYWDMRMFTFTADNTVVFTAARQTGWSGQSHTNETNNGASVPLKIYGIKSSGGAN